MNKTKKCLFGEADTPDNLVFREAAYPDNLVFGEAILYYGRFYFERLHSLPQWLFWRGEGVVSARVI